MAKNKNVVFYIIGAVFIVALMLYSQPDLFQKQETGMIGLTPHFYRDGVEVFPSKGVFSIVTPPGGVYDQLSFDINITNTGSNPIYNLQIDTASPLAFNNALPSNIVYLGIGQSIVWSSTLMTTSQFEGQTIDFWVRVSGEDALSQPTYEEASSEDITFIQYTPPAPSYWLDRDLDLTIGF